MFSFQKYLAYLLVVTAVCFVMTPMVFAITKEGMDIASCQESTGTTYAECQKRVQAESQQSGLTPVNNSTSVQPATNQKTPDKSTNSDKQSSAASASGDKATSDADSAEAGGDQTGGSSGDVTGAAGSANDFLGNGFQNITRYSENATNPLVDQRGGGFAENGKGTLNALLYNVKDYIKFLAGSLAVLWLVISAIRLVVAKDEEGIKSAHKGIQWSIIGLAAIFIVDVFVIALFEGGKTVNGTPGESLVSVQYDAGGGGKGVTIDDNGHQINISLDNTTRRDFMRGIALYFTRDIRLIFEWLKVLGGALAVMMIFFAGFVMVTGAGNEERVENAKKYLIHILTAFVTLLMLDTLIFQGIYPVGEVQVDGRAVYLNEPDCIEFLKAADKDNLSIVPQLPGAKDITDPRALDLGNKVTKESCLKSAATIGKTVSEQQILGAVRFFETIIGSLAVFFLVYSGMRIIGSFGNEEVQTKHKKQIFWSIGGLAIVLLSDQLVRKFFFITDYKTGTTTVNANQGLIDLAGVTNFIVTFVAVFSFVSLIVAGFLWVSNFGNEEVSGKAKKIILYAALGVLISVSAYAFVNTLLSGRSVGQNDFAIEATLNGKNPTK